MKVKKELKNNKNNNRKELFGVKIINDLLKDTYNPKYQLDRKKGVDLIYAEKLSRDLFI